MQGSPAGEQSVIHVDKKFMALGTINNVNSASSPGATHSGRPKTSTSDQNKQRVRAVLDRDRVKVNGDSISSGQSSYKSIRYEWGEG